MQQSVDVYAARKRMVIVFIRSKGFKGFERPERVAKIDILLIATLSVCNTTYGNQWIATLDDITKHLLCRHRGRLFTWTCSELSVIADDDISSMGSVIVCHQMYDIHAAILPSP